MQSVTPITYSPHTWGAVYHWLLIDKIDSHTGVVLHWCDGKLIDCHQLKVLTLYGGRVIHLHHSSQTALACNIRFQYISIKHID